MIHCKIRQLRKDLGLSQVTMARQLCISQNAYSLIERGVTRLDIERLAQISGILQVTKYYWQASSPFACKTLCLHNPVMLL